MLPNPVGRFRISLNSPSTCAIIENVLCVNLSTGNVSGTPTAPPRPRSPAREALRRPGESGEWAFPWIMSRFGASSHASHRQPGRQPRLPTPESRTQAAGSSAVGHFLTASRRVFPALKVGTVEAAMVMDSPVCGVWQRPGGIDFGRVSAATPAVTCAPAQAFV